MRLFLASDSRQCLLFWSYIYLCEFNNCMARFIPITCLMYIFSGLIWRALEKAKANIMKKLSDFCQEICLELIQHEVPEERGARVCSQLLGSATNKLNEMIAEQKQLVTEKQREISRIITPHIQVCNNWSQTNNERYPELSLLTYRYVTTGHRKTKRDIQNYHSSHTGM